LLFKDERGTYVSLVVYETRSVSQRLLTAHTLHTSLVIHLHTRVSLVPPLTRRRERGGTSAYFVGRAELHLGVVDGLGASRASGNEGREGGERDEEVLTYLGAAMNVGGMVGRSRMDEVWVVGLQWSCGCRKVQSGGSGMRTRGDRRRRASLRICRTTKFTELEVDSLLRLPVSLLPLPRSNERRTCDGERQETERASGSSSSIQAGE
jgi:hypothetical protein